MTKTHNKKGKKKHAKHQAQIAARSESVQSHQVATLGPGLAAGGLAKFLKDNNIADVAPWQEKIVNDNADNIPAGLTEGIVQAEAGDLIDRGSFAQYVDDDDLDTDPVAEREALANPVNEPENTDAISDFLEEHVQVGYIGADQLPGSGDQAEAGRQILRAAFGQLDVVTLRKLSKGQFSGGYSMKKPDLIEALISHGVQPPA